MNNVTNKITTMQTDMNDCKLNVTLDIFVLNMCHL